MKMKLLKLLSVVILSGALLSSCETPFDFLLSESQFNDEILLGANSTCRTVSQYDQESEISYYLYLSFHNPYDEFKIDSIRYDYEINLNSIEANHSYDKTGRSAYVRVSEYLKRNGRFANMTKLSQFFQSGYYISVFTSVGKLDTIHPFISKNYKIYKPGLIYTFNTISNPNDELYAQSAILYKKDFIFNFIKEDRS